MNGWAAVDYWLAREIVQRGVAALYLVAFISTLHQFRPLLGERGFLPAPALLTWARESPAHAKLVRPTIFRFMSYTDRRLVALCWLGITVSALLIIGVPQLGSSWAPMLGFLVLWGGYMSIVHIGQTFYGFGWEMLLLEAGFLAAFLGGSHDDPPVIILVLIWWLVFRLEFGAGMIKIRGGSEWRDLTAMQYHHETQPMPGPLSRQAHLLPAWFHRLEVLGNHVTQLAFPFLLFAPVIGLWVPGPWPGIVGTIAAVTIMATQLWLVLTGNFAWLNWATMVLAASAIALPGAVWRPESGGAAGAGLSLPWIIVTTTVGIGYALLSWPALRNLTRKRQLMNAAFNRWQLGNAYGAFGTVTRERIEYIIEATLSETPEHAEWREYEFKGKPGDVSRRPRQVAPYHLRLDWLMWFLPLGHSIDDWFTMMLVRLLEADRATLNLLRTDPFDGERPRWVRVTAYRYRFATRAEKKADGVVWVRSDPRVIVPPVSRRTDGAKYRPQ